jgi:PAS domain-containing protein
LATIFAVAFIAAAAALIYSIKVRRLTAENVALSSNLALRDAMA